MPTETVSITELKMARRKVAKLVLTDQVYLPIFERLEREIEAAERKSSVMDRVQTLAA